MIPRKGNAVVAFFVFWSRSWLSFVCGSIPKSVKDLLPVKAHFEPDISTEVLFMIHDIKRLVMVPALIERRITGGGGLS